MTVKLVVLYTQPGDADAFDEHYLGEHGPIVDTIPASSVGRAPGLSRRPTAASRPFTG
jgi:hypothetical protein